MMNQVVAQFMEFCHCDCRLARQNLVPVEVQFFFAKCCRLPFKSSSNRSNRIIPRMLSTISGVVASFGQLGRSSSKMLLPPHSNSTVEYFIVDIEGA